MTETVHELRLMPGEPIGNLRNNAAKKLKISPDNIKSWKLIKKSLDARKKNDIHYICTVKISTDDAEDEKPEEPLFVKDYDGPRPVVVGFGPAGMFAGLVLARCGLRPIIIERGQKVEKRQKAVELFKETGVLDPESNVQFGEGGAGTFSDGKLNTGTHDKRISYVLGEFYKHGANESVLYDSKPHIGTDVLIHVVKKFREEIISLGGEVFFETKLSDLIIENGKLTGITVSGIDGEKLISCRNLILSIGHSARDTFEMLERAYVPMERKIFSMGTRIEHLQRELNIAQYGKERRDLPPADYSVSVHFPNGSSAYSFCMCPGGYVIAAASETGRVCTNGMSYSGRSGVNSNSALLVNVHPEEFPGSGVLAGMIWQRDIEKKAYEYGSVCGNYYAPAQLVGDFLNNRESIGAGRILPTYQPGVRWGDIRCVLPEKITTVLAEAIPEFEKKIHGFSYPEAVLTVPETRSSSPVRILRGDGFESEVEGLFPCGEGAGYAGGITSAAVDGVRCAEAVALKTAEIKNR
ncbi:MAG: hypothetical protein Q4F31_00585 [Eubacteriales bacterium]|nr:hypothetical protein [Eubacteriales bacterium]